LNAVLNYEVNIILRSLGAPLYGVFVDITFQSLDIFHPWSVLENFFSVSQETWPANLSSYYSWLLSVLCL